MSSKKVDRALYGPSWAEVIIGAALSFVIGALLAAVTLVLKPVETVRVLPKEPVRDMVYYIEGSKDSTKGRTWQRKRQMLVEGSSVTLTEDELNAVFPATAEKPKPAAPAEKGKAAAPVAAPASDGLIVPGAPNFRVLDGQLQVGVPCTLNLLGLKQEVLVVATGDFRKDGEGFVFKPEKFRIGSLTVSLLPMVEGFVAGKILAARPLPEDLAAAWKKLTDVTIEGKMLKLTM